MTTAATAAQVARQRPRVRLPRRHRALGRERPPLIPRRSRDCGPRLGRLDVTRATAQLRLADVRRGCPHREDRPPCRLHQDDHNRNRLPQADPSRSRGRRRSHGHPVSQSGPRALSYAVGYSTTKGHDFRPVVMASDLVGRTGFEPVTSSESGLLRNLAYVRQTRSRCLRCCPRVTVIPLSRPPHRACGGHGLFVPD